jgi:nucleoside-diphosphate-sugar epimerase
MDKKILLTGACGFVGWKTALFLLGRGYSVIGVDNLNEYYDPKLKGWRLEDIAGSEHGRNFKFVYADIEEKSALKDLFSDHKFEAVVNLAARAGVRASLVDPFVYMRTNAMGTLNLLDLSRDYGCPTFVLASTSSLYAGQPVPFTEDLPVNTPISPYAASKKSAEALAYTYHYLYSLDITILRYFTVYGPAGRPDMSPFRFIKWIDGGNPVELFGDGTQKRDFTYIDDVADATLRAMETPAGYEIINIGNNRPHELNYLIELIEKGLGKKARRDLKPFHKADIKETWADIAKARKILKWSPATSLEEGVERTISWHVDNRDWLAGIQL